MNVMPNADRPTKQRTDERADRDANTSGDAPNTQQLRARIPSARTVTTDSAHEPAAASFDTDDEAAGRPAQSAAVRQALAHEGRLPAQQPGSASWTGSLAAIVIAGALVALAVLFWIAVS